MANAGARVATAAVAGTAVGVGSAFVVPWQVTVLAGWDAATAVFLVWVWGEVARLTAEETKAVATREDPTGRWRT